MKIIIQTSELKEILDKHFGTDKVQYTINYHEPRDIWMNRHGITKGSIDTTKSKEELDKKYPQISACLSL